jgi:MSHA biogenesis protein MshE
VLAQRLVRLNCESCMQDEVPDAGQLSWISREYATPIAGRAFRRGRGCSHCNGTGLSGRTGIYEMLEMTSDMVAAINQNRTDEFRALAEQALHGRSLRQQALELALAGRAPLAEVIRVASELGD